MIINCFILCQININQKINIFLFVILFPIYQSILQLIIIYSNKQQLVFIMLKPSNKLLTSYSRLLPNFSLDVHNLQQATNKHSKNEMIFQHFYGTMKQQPSERLSHIKIMSNLRSSDFSLRIINNMKIAIDCTKIALKYSKCYLCKFPPLKYTLRQIYKMQENDKKNEEVYKLFLKQCPIPKALTAFDYFDYQNKRIYAALSMIMSKQKIPTHQYDNMIKFMTSLQLVNLGFVLHHSIGKSYRLNFITRIALRLMSKQMKDSYLVLGGDYFHIKGSVLAAQTGNVRLSQLLSEVQIDLCKYVHLTENLRNKIGQKGYNAVDLEQIYNISVLKTSPLVKGLLGIDIIQQKQTDVQTKQAYQCMSLLMLYRKDLQNFMFDFKDIVKKYGEYMTNKLNFDVEESLPYYIFFQGAQNSKRIDLAYLNTVKMMSEQIQYLQKRIIQILGAQKSQKIMKQFDYYLMIYS